MIFTLIINSLLLLVQFILSLFNGLIPPMPATIINAIDPVFPYFAIPIGLFRTFLTDTFFSSVIILIIAYWVGIPIVHFILWLFHKIFAR